MIEYAKKRSKTINRASHGPWGDKKTHISATRGHTFVGAEDLLAELLVQLFDVRQRFVKYPQTDCQNSSRARHTTIRNEKRLFNLS